MDQQRTIRYAAVTGAFAAAVLYLLIGLEVLKVGESTSGTNDIFSFGALMAAVFTVVGVLLLVVRSRLLLWAVAALQVIVLVGYVAFAGIRNPPFELWGILVKACQAVVLGAVAWLVLRTGGRRLA